MTPSEIIQNLSVEAWNVLADAHQGGLRQTPSGVWLELERYGLVTGDKWKPALSPQGGDFAALAHEQRAFLGEQDGRVR